MIILIDLTMLFTLLGVLGSVITIIVFFLLQSERISSQNIWFPVMNGVAALLLMVSIAHKFDIADLGGVLSEIAWLAISIYGIIKILKERKIDGQNQ